jgi:hypothetical protein
MVDEKSDGSSFLFGLVCERILASSRQFIPPHIQHSKLPPYFGTCTSTTDIETEGNMLKLRI